MKAEMNGDDYRNRVGRPASGQRPTGHVSPGQMPQADPADVERAWAQLGSESSGAWRDGEQAPPNAHDAMPYAPDATRPSRQQPKRGHTVLKVLGLLVVGCLGLNLMAGVVGVGLLALGLSSCVASCSDNPVGDSREHAAFIASLEATDADLLTYDALYGCIDSLQASRANRNGEGDKVPTADELRAQVAAGAWPKDEGTSLNPRVWVRIAELSKTYLQNETGEQWEVVDFSYPFPDNGPIPYPAKRDEDTFAITRLICTRGKDEGLYTSVQYYRWRSPAQFENSLSEDRASFAERTAQQEAVARVQALGGRRYLIADGDLYIWERDGNDELRDPATFVRLANELAEQMGTYADIALLEASTPVRIGYSPIHGDYRNEKPPEDVLPSEFEDTRVRLVKAGSFLYLDHAAGDELFSAYRRQDEDITEDDLRGSLAPSTAQSDRDLWRGPKEGSVFDEQVAGEVAQVLGQPDTSRLIATSCLDVDDNWTDELTGWVIVPRGVMAEDPAGFCQQADALLDVFWAQAPQDPERRTLVYVHIYIVDEDDLRDGTGAACTFGDMRAAAQADPTALDAYDPAVLLNVMQHDSRWEDEDDRKYNRCKPSDVRGPIARSRAWYDDVEAMSR